MLFAPTLNPWMVKAEALASLRSVAMAVCLLAVTGCGGPDEAAPSTTQTQAVSTNTLTQQLAQRDVTIWRDEVTAREHEKTFVQLADDLRRANDKTAVLAQFEFERIFIPRRDGPLATLGLGIRRQRFTDTEPLTLPHAAWVKALAQFRDAGWSLVQFEWRHEKFTPSTQSGPAMSEFAFELHGEQETNRFIIRGTLLVEWADDATHAGLRKPRQLTVRNLSLLERAGLPGFNNHAVIEPEPDRPGGQVNLHPLIVADLNGDAHDDILLPGVNKVLLNDGQANLRPVDFIAKEIFYALKEAGVLADFDGDGKIDYLGVAEMGLTAKMLTLYHGHGTVPFASAPEAVWDAQRREFARYQFTAASAITAGDIDGDGDLDVFVAQYRPPYVGGNLPTPYYDANDGYPSYLLLNDGHGKFDLAKPQPALAAKQHRRTLAASFVDLDNDGDMDLVTLNDFSGVDLFYNDSKGNFTDETARLSNRHLFGMGHCFADFDRDGALDFLAIGMDVPTVRRLEALGLAPPEFPNRTKKRADMAYGNRLYLARGGRWTEPPWAGALARTGWNWGTSAFDFDNDGDVDLYIANGHVSGASSADYDSFYWTRDIYLSTSREDRATQRYFDDVLRGLNTGATSWNGYQHNAFFLDTGTNDYLNVAWLMDVAHETDCRAVVTADLNEDGRPDLVVTEAKWQGTPNIMRHRLLVHLNQVQTSNHWIGIRLGSAAPAIGAKAFFVTTEHGTRVAQVVTGDSFQSQGPSALHFGLGESVRVSELRVVWPNGKATILKNPTPDRWHFVEP